MAELRYGAARNVDGLVLLATLGTGIGSALLNGGRLIPNSELGHLELNGVDAEKRASSSARDTEDLSWDEWAQRLQRYFAYVENLLAPDLIVVESSMYAKHAAHYLPLLHLRAPIVPAQLGNSAGIVGAAWLAAQPDRRGSDITSGGHGTRTCEQPSARRCPRRADPARTHLPSPRPRHLPSKLDAGTAADFWEVGASGRIYSREYIWTILAERYAHPAEDPWETSGFELPRAGAGRHIS